MRTTLIACFITLFSLTAQADVYEASEFAYTEKVDLLCKKDDVEVGLILKGATSGKSQVLVTQNRSLIMNTATTGVKEGIYMVYNDRDGQIKLSVFSTATVNQADVKLIHNGRLLQAFDMNCVKNGTINF